MNVKQYTFAELAEKQVVNVADGRQLGHTCDMVFTAYGRILGLVVPGKKSFFKSFASSDNLFVPWNNIVKIGGDVILVEMVGGVSVCKEEDDDDDAGERAGACGAKRDDVRLSRPVFEGVCECPRPLGASALQTPLLGMPDQ